MWASKLVNKGGFIATFDLGNQILKITLSIGKLLSNGFSRVLLIVSPKNGILIKPVFDYRGS